MVTICFKIKIYFFFPIPVIVLILILLVSIHSIFKTTSSQFQFRDRFQLFYTMQFVCCINLIWRWRIYSYITKKKYISISSFVWYVNWNLRNCTNGFIFKVFVNLWKVNICHLFIFNSFKGTLFSILLYFFLYNKFRANDTLCINATHLLLLLSTMFQAYLYDVCTYWLVFCYINFMQLFFWVYFNFLLQENW